ncbi:MAG: TetR/AcrR family transcriptional regulator [Acidimicrobiales bacterium]|nr:TetR/AcrR family transcriptional regulator [Acidimicrobiales bacterium]
MQNSILNDGPDDDGDVATRIAQQTLASRGADYSSEVRRLLDAGREAMRRCGTDTRPRVADIVAEAGLSNDAFYRHFASKDALVQAILEDGTIRLRSYLAHQMDKVAGPEAKVRHWVEGILAQAVDPETAATTTAVMWNSGGIAQSLSSPGTATVLAPLLEDPFAALDSPDPTGDATLVAHAVVGALSDHLRSGDRPTSGTVDRVTAFCLAALPR